MIFDSSFLAVVRAVFYAAIIFLILFDLPAVKDNNHRVVLLSMAAWFLALLASVIALGMGALDVYVVVRDYIVTFLLLCVVASHLWWLYRRAQK